MMRNSMTPRTFTRRSRTAAAAFGLAIALGACADREGAGSTDTADPLAQEMQNGVNLLYQTGDPVRAEAIFRGVLRGNPTHYGAQYQLAVALDRGGRPGEARTQWEVVLRNAEAINDSTTARTARSRLASPDTASQSALMTLGTDLLYRQENPTAAAEQFRRVLQRNATHYGATYQLAEALERSGQRAQARPLWQKVLGMAATY
ncbi:MAG: tetratricopeptide repeat protein, partial [Gemmatimonadaceae bacterium]